MSQHQKKKRKKKKRYNNSGQRGWRWLGEARLWYWGTWNKEPVVLVFRGGTLGCFGPQGHQRNGILKRASNFD